MIQLSRRLAKLELKIPCVETFVYLWWNIHFYIKVLKESDITLAGRIVRKRSSLTNIISTQKFTKPFKRHCVKGVRLRSYSGPHFPAFGLNMERYSISPYSVRMRENADQNHSEYGHSSRSAYGHVRAHDRLKTIHLLNQNTYGHL